ncbi:MAG: cytochrome b/b6 domain-containing protein [Spongiibacteraceae bacterium]
MADGDLRQGQTPATSESSATDKILVWDLPVRIFHWALVLAVLGAFITDRLGVTYFKYHVWCGYTVLVLVAFRLIWGFVGTYHARFLNFVRGPKAILNYARGSEKKLAGHNPLGALMVVVLLAGLAVQAVTGLFGNDEIFNVGPLYGYISNDLSLELTSLHRKLFYWIAGAIAFHIVAVIFYRIVKKEKLIEAMFTGRKAEVAREEGIASSRIYLALAIVIIVSVLLAWLIATAPIPVVDVEY